MAYMEEKSAVEGKFADLNYYEMLDIRPDAVPFEIRHAYQNATQMYEHGSLVSYSFFSEKERKEILAHIEKAYFTLVNEKERREYDAELVRRGELKGELCSGKTGKQPVSIFAISRSNVLKPACQKKAELKAKIAECPRIGAIAQKNDICGADLQEIRQTLGVTLEQIADETKIRLDYLRAIEASEASRLPAPVFLKGFVKAYLKHLCLDPVEEISSRYMAALAAQNEGKAS